MNEYARHYEEPNRDYIKLLHGKYDLLFKEIVISEWCVSSDGNVESPSGYFSLTEIPNLENEMHEAVDSKEEYEWPDSGWYITQELNTGIIWVFEYPNEEKAQKEYDRLLAEFIEWNDDEDDQ